MLNVEAPRDTEAAALRSRIAELEATLATTTATLVTTTATLATVTAERDKLRRAYELLKEHLDLLKRRIYLAKAERVDVRQLELEFAETKAALDRMGAELGLSETRIEELGVATEPTADEEPKSRPRPKGRRNLAEFDMPEERIEILDAVLESTAERIGFEESCRLGYRRGGPVRIVVARATYKQKEASVISPSFVTVPVPKEIVRRSLLAPWLRPRRPTIGKIASKATQIMRLRPVRGS